MSEETQDQKPASPPPSKEEKKRRPSRRGRRPSSKKKSAAQPVTTEVKPDQDAEPIVESPAAGDAPKKNNEKKSPQQKPAAGGKSQQKSPPRATPQAAPEQQDKARKLLINCENPEECRVILVENGKIESFQVESVVKAQAKGNIYKGRIVTIEPNLQTAFVDLGLEKNGFLPFSDIHPEYYRPEIDPETHWKDLSIQNAVRKGQEVLVQVVKEPSGSKGASLTTYLSLAGRYIVLMPGSDSAGISRKLGDQQRKSLREMIADYKIPEGIGYIIRTASENVTKTALLKDLRYLLKLWETIKKQGQESPTPSLVHKEQNVLARFLRDNFSTDIQEILVDSQEGYDQINNFLTLLPARQGKIPVKLYQGNKPLFNHYQIEEQINKIYQPRVNLPSGGSIIINPTEALVAVDVNSGRTSKDKNFEDTIFLTNMEAAAELAHQLRLRDLGGLIVVDFIDMRNNRNIREVEKHMKTCMKPDRAKIDMTRISKFGILQISRQRLAPPVQDMTYKTCSHCRGLGIVPSVETLSLVYIRKIRTGLTKKGVIRVICKLPWDAAQYLLNKKRDDLFKLEKDFRISIHIEPVPAMHPDDQDIQFIREETVGG